MDAYTHFQHTFMFKQLVKWILHPMTPFKIEIRRESSLSQDRDQKWADSG